MNGKYVWYSLDLDQLITTGAKPELGHEGAIYQLVVLDDEGLDLFEMPSGYIFVGEL